MYGLINSCVLHLLSHIKLLLFIFCSLLMLIHILDNQLFLWLIRLFFNRYQRFLQHLLFLINSLFKDVLLNSIERVLVRYIHSSVSLCLRSLHAHLNSGFISCSVGRVSSSGPWDTPRVLLCQGESEFVFLKGDSLVHELFLKVGWRWRH